MLVSELVFESVVVLVVVLVSELVFESVVVLVFE